MGADPVGPLLSRAALERCILRRSAAASSGCRAPSCRSSAPCCASAVTFSFRPLSCLGSCTRATARRSRALAGTLACFPVAALRAITRPNVTFGNVLDAMIDGARNTLAVALACACAGDHHWCRGDHRRRASCSPSSCSGWPKSLLLALILTALAGIVLGMGMPTTPAYIVMTALLVPAMIKLGVIAPAAHMFAFYFAILSAITPPVALAVYAAAGLAKSDLWATGWAAVQDRSGRLHRAVHVRL